MDGPQGGEKIHIFVQACGTHLWQALEVDCDKGPLCVVGWGVGPPQAHVAQARALAVYAIVCLQSLRVG